MFYNDFIALLVLSMQHNVGELEDIKNTLGVFGGRLNATDARVSELDTKMDAQEARAQERTRRLEDQLADLRRRLDEKALVNSVSADTPLISESLDS